MQFAAVHKRSILQNEISEYRFKLSERSLQLLPDYEKRMMVSLYQDNHNITPKLLLQLTPYTRKVNHC